MLLVNEVRQTTRHFSRDKRSISREVQPQLTEPPERTPGTPDTNANTPLEDAIHREQLAQLSRALEKLSNDYRTVIQLRSIQRKTMADVAREMDRSVDATAKLWYRAIQNLRKIMPDVEPTR